MTAVVQGSESSPERQLDSGDVWVTLPCMGRLPHLQRTAPLVLSSQLVNYCLVDYSCPQNCGDWFESEYSEPIHEGHAMVQRVRNRPRFNKSASHNAGAQACIQRGAEYLCFLDADTIVRPGFFEYVVANLRPDRFLIAGLRPDGADQPWLTGTLVVSAEAFAMTGGFDESYEGWGAEDIEFRLRLHLLHGLAYSEIPLELMEAIDHGHDLRTRHYEIQSIRRSNSRNLARTREKQRKWLKLNNGSLESAQRLWYRPQRAERRAALPPEGRPRHTRRAKKLF